MTSIKGVIKSVSNRKSNGWGVFIIDYFTNEGERIPSKMLGIASKMEEGDYFVAEGNWENSTFKGISTEQFQFNKVNTDLPTIKREIKLFLKKLLNYTDHGVREVSIDEFVEKNDDNILFSIEKNPSLLNDLTVDVNEYGEKIKKDWLEKVSGRKAIITMQNAGVKTALIDRIMDAYSNEATDIIEDNPYKFSTIEGVGFFNADKIGKYVGISANNVKRLTYALREIIEKNTNNLGDTYIESEKLIEELNEKTGAKPGVILQLIKFLAEESQDNRKPLIVVDSINGKQILSLGDIYNSEAVLAKSICMMIANGRKGNKDYFREKINNAETEHPFDLVQKSAVLQGCTEPFSAIIGGAGTGKTSILKMIISLCKDKENVINLCAPSGKASQRMSEATGENANTIHKLLEAIEDKKNNKSIFRKNSNNRLEDNSLIIVDETSMVDTETASAIFAAINKDNCRVLFVGDTAQLPSVGPGAVLRDIIESNVVPYTELVNIYRSDKNSNIAYMSRQIRDGIVPKLKPKVFDGGVLFFPCEKHKIVNGIKHFITKVIPSNKEKNYDNIFDTSVIAPMRRKTAGTYEINKILSDELNLQKTEIINKLPFSEEGKPIPRIGDRVMLTKNDDPNNVSNGDLGVILDTVEKKDNNNRLCKYFTVKYDTGKIIDTPVEDIYKIDVAYAYTIHKSQGSQNKIIIIPLSDEHNNMWNQELIYTAWTRSEDLVVLVGDEEVFKKAVLTPARKRKTRLKGFIAGFANRYGLTNIKSNNQGDSFKM